MSATDDYGAGVNDWVNVVRRARLAPSTKLVALLLASYANPDGTHVYPGVARLSVESGYAYGTVKAALRKLRQAGLIEVTRRGARKAGQSDEYRLILAPDLLERCDVPAPDEEKRRIGELRERRKVPWRKRSTVPPETVELPPEPNPYGSPDDRRTVSTVIEQHGSTVTHRPPTLHKTPTGIYPPSTAAEVLTQRAGSREAGAAEDQEHSQQREDHGRPIVRGVPEPTAPAFNLRSRRGTDLARRAAADRLTAWQQASASGAP